MKQLSFSIFFIIFGLPYFGYTQTKQVSEKVKALETKIEVITKEERAALKEEVKGIDQRQESGELTPEEAQKLKEIAAEKRVTNIEVRTAEIKEEIKTLEENTVPKSTNSKVDSVIVKGSATKPKKYRIYGRTDSQLVLAIGFNNAIQEGRSFNDSDYKFGGSRFLEIGWAWRTPLFKNSNFVRFRYGFSFQINNLKPTDNRRFVDNGGETILETFPLDLDKSKLKFTNLVVPIHFEFGPSRIIKRENYTRYSIRRKFKIGLGGYAGFNIGARQKLIYKEGSDRIKEKIKGDYNMNNLVYGLSSYVAWGSTGIYVKYDLSELFDDNQPGQRNISLGVRFDMD
jgi:hypothetical protein